MNIWIFLFFFAIAAGLVVLFVVGTSCGVSQRISHEDACDPYAPKEKKQEVQPVLVPVINFNGNVGWGWMAQLPIYGDENGSVKPIVVGTSCGVSQRISHEDACDPYAPKEKKQEVQPVLVPVINFNGNVGWGWMAQLPIYGDENGSVKPKC